MLGTAIVGGGLCGLALAAGLQARGRSSPCSRRAPGSADAFCRLPQKRPECGSIFGPTWYWPDIHPGMTKLVGDLGLASFPQHDGGTVLRLSDPDEKAEASENESVHADAWRVEGGMASVIEALAQKIPQERLRLEHAIVAIVDCGGHVELHMRCGDAKIIVEARRVVLAMPPRIAEELVRFEPNLEPPLLEAMRETYTWMAAEAKAIIAYRRPLWREAGFSGNAYVTHQQAVFHEIFDACDAAGARAALGGFLALSPSLRKSFKDGLPVLMGNQMAQIFGPELEHGEQHYHDWAAEEYTCARRDLGRPLEHPNYGDPRLRQPQWDGKLFLGGSETAGYGGGYMEGALDAARRLLRDIGRFAPVAGVQGGAIAPAQNADSVAAFGKWVAGRRAQLLETYRRRLNVLLASPDKEIVTQRAMLATMEQIFSEALLRLEDLSFDMEDVPIERGRSALTPEILKSFDGFLQTLLDCAIEFNRTSCALSNFPAEAKPPKDYVQAILRDIAVVWKEFCLSVNAFFIERTPTPANSL